MPNGERLRITHRVLETFHRHRQMSFRLFESGGILLGSVVKKHVIIDKASTPGERDKRGIAFFHRNKGRAQSLIDKAFLKSEGQQIYLGEWHTHREQTPSPSFIDNCEIRRAYKKSKLNIGCMVYIIVGNKDNLGNIWVGYYDGQIMRDCQCITQHPTQESC